MIKSVLFGKESRDKILIGVQKITDAVRVTMGSNGKCVLIGNAVWGNDGVVHLPTIVSKDGFTVTKHFELPDAIENRGAMMIKEAAYKTVEVVGDATTLTCVLAEYLITNGMKLIDDGANSQLLKKGMDKALEYVIEELKKMSTPVKGDLEKIKQIATVSSNNDEMIGSLIAEAYSKIGDDGIIEVEESKGIGTEIKISDGLKFERGWVSNLFVNNRAKELCVFENPLILLYEKRIMHHTQIEKAVSISQQYGKPLVIICEDADEEGLAFLAVNNYQGRFRVCVIKAPEFGGLRTDYMEDIALLTGGTYISDSKGTSIGDIDIDYLGQAKKIVISKTETVIIGGEGDKQSFDEFVNDLKMNLTQAKSEDEKYPIEKRIARLTGDIAVIQVGAATETELKEKLDRWDDAVRATRAGIVDGIVPGGGIAFLRIPLPIVKEEYLLAGYNLLFDSLTKPVKQICQNAEIDPVFCEKILSENGNIGYNALTGEIVDMIDAGIIDATKALKNALINAVSVAGMVLTSECSIIATT